MNAPTTREPDDELSDDLGLALPAEVVQSWEPLLAQVPEAGGDGSGYLSILSQIAAAQDPRDLDAPWRSAGLEPFEGQALIVRGIRRMPSDYEQGLGWFLIVDAVVKGTGEAVAITTGSVGVVAQLVKAHVMGALPLTVVVRGPRKPTKQGYRPMHLEVAR